MRPKRVYPGLIYGRPTIIFGEVLRTPSFGFGQCGIGSGMSRIRAVYQGIHTGSPVQKEVSFGDLTPNGLKGISLEGWIVNGSPPLAARFYASLGRLSEL